MYQNVNWIDRVVDQDTGEVIQEGTLQSAGNFNQMEGGIGDGYEAAATALFAIANLVAQNAVEEIDVTLTNTVVYPRNNSVKTISMSTTRTQLSYTVETIVTESEGDVGDIVIYDKQLNGFKVKFDGSATSAAIKLFVKGGM